VNQCAKGKIKHNGDLLHRLLKCVSLSTNCPIAGQERCQHHDTRWPNCREQVWVLKKGLVESRVGGSEYRSEEEFLRGLED
jgi:hypothetical protein